MKHSSKYPRRLYKAAQSAHMLDVCCAFSPPEALPEALIHFFEMLLARSDLQCYDYLKIYRWL